jgi:hypothetical protein
MRWISSGDGSQPDIDCDLIWMDDWWWITGGGQQEMVDRRWIMGDRWQYVSFLYADIKVTRGHTILEITTLISNYKVSIERRYACIRCTGGMAPPSAIQSTIQRFRIKHLQARVSIPNQIPSHSYNADTAQAVRD